MTGRINSNVKMGENRLKEDENDDEFVVIVDIQTA